jgi:hypothetical protein
LPAEKATDLSAGVVVVDIQGALPSGPSGADRADSALLMKQLLIVRQADPIERLEISIPDIERLADGAILRSQSPLAAA